VFLDRAHPSILADRPLVAPVRVPTAQPPGRLGGVTAQDAPVVVVGQVGRDLVLQVDQLPEAGGSATVRRRREVLGGKGANQAVALRQLGLPVAVVAVLGDDPAGNVVLAQAAADGVQTEALARRAGVPSALLVDVVAPRGVRRLLEDVPEGVLLTAADVAAAGPLLHRAPAVLLQLQQPGEAVRAALERTADGALTVADGAPSDDATAAALLGTVEVLRADAREAARWVGHDLTGLGAVRAAAVQLCRQGPRVVSLAAGDEGDLTVWREPDGRLGEQLVPLLGDDPLDPTGAGDAVVAALTAALLRGADPATAAWEAGAAAALTVARLGGRPRLDRAEVTVLAGRSRADARAAERAPG
jgi:ribokinase